MKGVVVTKQAFLSLTADDWELYINPGRDRAAIGLNSIIASAFNSGLSRSKVMEMVLPLFKNYDEFGAMDTEPLNHLEDILDYLYRDYRLRRDP